MYNKIKTVKTKQLKHINKDISRLKKLQYICDNHNKSTYEEDQCFF